ncbi:MAG: hypothetical protein HC867_05510 [Bacteroidia bacterium]|nr:hypothetical protein [Bacteroidia bacterium]
MPMTYLEGHRILAEDLFSIYAKQEAWKIADMIFEKLAGNDKKEFKLMKKTTMSGLDQQRMDKYKSELLQHRPVQYVLNEAWFQGKKFLLTKESLSQGPKQMSWWAGSPEK